jgi:hypothetical protein
MNLRSVFPAPSLDERGSASLTLTGGVWRLRRREGRQLKLVIEISPLNFSAAKGTLEMDGALSCHRGLGIFAEVSSLGRIEIG